MNTDNYVYDDKGSGNFGDYDIEHEIYTNAPNSSTNQWGYVGVSNSVDDAYNWTSGQVHWCQPASASQFWMIERLTDKGNANNDVIAQHARNVRYYMKMERSGTTATLKSYTDSGRTTLEDTASITSETTTYQYIYGVSSWNVGTSGRSNSYESDNLEIIDAGVGPAPTFIPKVMFF
ncbi:MAG: hypothetical protein KAJ18_11860 [Candidatus Omnitrophica bacterium]|nr:hypothetical protein [Candidatus Omnitrophota bacterium]